MVLESAGGRHVLGEFKSSSFELLNNGEKLAKVLAEVSRKSGFSVKMKIHKFSPYGITAIAVLGQSHVIVHTFPEFKHMSVDAYSCVGDPNRIIDGLKKRLKLKELNVRELDRRQKIEDVKSDLIVHEMSKGYYYEYKIYKMLLDKKSEYQRIRVVRNKTFGKMLFLDDDLQFSESDERVYNQEITRNVPKGASVLLFGGDGSVTKDLLKAGVSNVIVVERDLELVKACSMSFAGVKAAFSNRRVKLVFDDALDYISKKDGKFDAVLLDMIPSAMGMADKEFYGKFLPQAHKLVVKNGVLSFQLCSIYQNELVGRVKRILGRHFRKVGVSQRWIPSYGTLYNFVHAFK